MKTYDPSKVTRKASFDILAPNFALFCRRGTLVDGVAVDEDNRPDYETAADVYADIGPLGSLTPELDNKECTLLLATSNGAWKKQTVVLNEGMKLKMKLMKMCPEVWEAAYGLSDPINDGEERELNAGTFAGIEGWFCTGVKRSHDGSDRIKPLYAYGLLVITTPPALQDDFASAEADFHVYPNNPQSSLTMANVQTIAQG